MNRSFKLGGLGLAIAFVALVAPALGGCADEDTAGLPKYPEAIGYDVPAEPPANGGLTADPSAAPPAPPPAPPPDPAAVATGDDGQPGDVAIGGDESQYADTDPSALTDFHTALDPYGSWVDDPNYGTVWSPSDSVVGDDFQPYVSNGQWTYDDSGDYVWASDYDWGWAPFHYGRWVYLGSRWGWVPGRTYAGAWVSWRWGGGYLGWAPLPPTWYWRGGYAFGLGHVPYAPYSFCGYHDVFGPNVRGRLVPGAQVGTVAGRTQPYAPASPSVGRSPAHPTVGGPSPSMLGLSGREVVRTPASNMGIQHAQAFSRPGTAQSLGAHAPALAPASSRGTFAARGDSSLAGRSAMSAYGRNAPVATAPRYQGVSPAPYHAPSYSHYGGSTYGSYGGYPGSRSFGTNSYGSYGGTRYSSPSYSQHFGAYGGYGGAYGGYRGGTSGRSSGHPSAPSEGGGESAPPVHSSGGFRGGGFHGGGHAGGGGRR
jgi:hypothetical protein